MSISHLVPAVLLVLATTAGAPSPVPSTSQDHEPVSVVSEHCETITVTLPDGRTESVTVCHIPDWPPLASVV